MTDRARINHCQRMRRARLNRIDYADVSIEAMKIIDAQRCNNTSGTASAILNRIVTEWADQMGFKAD